MSDKHGLDRANRNDLIAWLKLAAEVEHLFGPMCDQPEFRSGLLECFEHGRALCVRSHGDSEGTDLRGGIILSPDANRIDWFAVAENSRGMGIGRTLLNAALAELDTGRDITVQTFAGGHPGGLAARGLYHSAGFLDDKPGEPTPAGVPTIFMVRPGDNCQV